MRVNTAGFPITRTSQTMLGAKVYFDPAWINIRTQGRRWSKQSIINATRMLEAKKPNSFDMWENIHLWGPWGGREKMVKMVLLPLTFLMHLYSPQQGRLPRYSTSSCGSNIRKANYISMICHYCASGVNGSIFVRCKTRFCYAAADEIVECKIIQGKESLSAIRKIPLKTHFSHTFVKKKCTA